MTEQQRHELHTHYNELLKQAQEAHAQQRRDMVVQNKQTNYQMAREKRDRDQAAFTAAQ